MSAKALIIGSNGQDGHYLSKVCISKGIVPITLSRSNSMINASVSDYSSMESILKRIKPDFIFHFAAISSTSHEYLIDNFNAITLGTVNILEIVRKMKLNTKIFITGSGVQFANYGKPILETDNFEVRDAYSMARIQSVYAARYFRILGLRVYVGYLFHHESPLRKPNHVSQKIVNAVQHLKKGDLVPLELHNIDVMKEWTFAGDVAKGIFTLVNQDDVFECVIGSGKCYSIREWLDICYSSIDENWREYVKYNNDLIPEYEILVSNPKTINSLGWFPEVSIEELASMMISTI